MRGRLYPGRFTLAYLALGVAVAAAAVGLAVDLGGTSAAKAGPHGPAWSDWQPKGSGLGLEQHVAAHVAAGYRLGLVQFLDIFPRAPAVKAKTGSVPIGHVVIRGRNGKPDTVYNLTRGTTAMYILCGLGRSCTIARGKPAAARTRLVRREILELALYTFRYEHGIDSVIVVMPPHQPKVRSKIVFLRRHDLRQALSRPLAATLSSRTPTPKTITQADQLSVLRYMRHRAFSFSVSGAADGTVVLVLRHLHA